MGNEVYNMRTVTLPKHNHTSLPDRLWFIYMIYLKGYGQDFKNALRLYDMDRSCVDQMCIAPPGTIEIDAMEFIRKYLNE